MATLTQYLNEYIKQLLPHPCSLSRLHEQIPLALIPIPCSYSRSPHYPPMSFHQKLHDEISEASVKAFHLGEPLRESVVCHDSNTGPKVKRAMTYPRPQGEAANHTPRPRTINVKTIPNLDTVAVQGQEQDDPIKEPLLPIRPGPHITATSTRLPFTPLKLNSEE